MEGDIYRNKIDDGGIWTLLHVLGEYEEKFRS